jgi:hypothetical protein
MFTMPIATRRKVVAAAIALLMGLALLVVAGAGRPSHSKPAPIDFRRAETLAWSLELGAGSPDALTHVTCTDEGADRYECVGKNAGDETQTVHIRVTGSGSAWQSLGVVDG